MSEQLDTTLGPGRVWYRILTWLVLAMILACPDHLQAVQTKVEIDGTRWLINGKPTNSGTPCEGLLMNVRMVNATFEDPGKPEFDAEQNTDEFVEKIPQ